MDTVSTLNMLMDKASLGTPLTIGQDQVIRTDIGGLASRCGPTECVIEPQTRTNWYDVHAGRSVNLPAGPKADPHAVATPGIHRPTLEWLASLPTDPEKLLRQLRIDVGEHDRWTVDGWLWDTMAQLYMDCELAMTPAQRVSLLRAATHMTGLSTRHVNVDGRALIAIRHTGETRADEILFDPGTGRATGRATYYLGEDFTIHNPFEPGGVSRLLWTQVLEPLP